ncbi:hypothetical protein SNE25_07870 [Mucilaginibacter sabulilitoris]|uniref:DUF4837 domain-containing protein n=1 Tax=Mucilaginibacter sabulilitoris TaxID=1173583 RepID=A0ABZ0TTF1_9SPHI|nr:hypothetical protein [Mucilaginibacter sabulilitoris]WPU95438.1 hypothetical protein SNE25_07870 [Mucilaginibacter sabulilitoris]
MKQNIIAFVFTLLLVYATIIIGCSNNNPNIVKHNGEKDLISFKSIEGISYTEINRRQKNGLSFSEYGYQLEPQWKVNFVSDDSVSIYSPGKKRFLNFPLTRGYDSVFNTARTWLKVKKMSKDSLVLEMLKAQNDSVDIRGAGIYMTFYADNYVKNVLRSDIITLRHASRKDSLFIKSLVTKANSDLKKAFAARQPVAFISKSPSVNVEKWKAEGNLLNNFDTSDDYFNPTFNITINKAYANFYYSFSVYVDEKGQMYYGEPLIAFLGESLRESYIHESQDVMNSYLKYYLQVIPGKTLNMPHTSLINIHVEGKAKP